MAGWIHNARVKSENFFGRLQNGARQSLRFLNGTIVPGAIKAQRTIANVTKAIQEDPNISVKNKARVSNASRLSGIGLERLQGGAQSTNRIAKAVGLD